MFRIAQISDCHLSDDRPFFVDNFRRCVTAVRAAAPDLVLNSGDLALDGSGREADLAAARRLHDEIGLPLRFLPGNHDLGDSPEAPAHGPAIDEARRARYRAHFGPDFWRFDVPGWRVLGLNAQLLGSDLPAIAEQDALVHEAVASLDGRRLALFLHKPLFDATPDEDAVGGRFVNPTPRRALLAALGEVRPALVACGHVHQFRETVHAGSRHVWAPSTGYVIPDRRQPRYGVKEVGWVEHMLAPDGRHESRFRRVEGMVALDIEDFPGAYRAT